MSLPVSLALFYSVKIKLANKLSALKRQITDPKSQISSNASNTKHETVPVTQGQPDWFFFRPMKFIWNLFFEICDFLTTYFSK